MWSLKPVPCERSQGFLEKGLSPGLEQLVYKMNLGHLIMPESLTEEEIDLKSSSDLLNAIRRQGPGNSQGAWSLLLYKAASPQPGRQATAFPANVPARIQSCLTRVLHCHTGRF